MRHSPSVISLLHDFAHSRFEFPQGHRKWCNQNIMQKAYRFFQEDRLNDVLPKRVPAASKIGPSHFYSANQMLILKKINKVCF